MKGAKPFLCEEEKCKKAYKSQKWLNTHMKINHPMVGQPLTKEYSLPTHIQLNADMTFMADTEDLLQMHPKDEARIFAELDTVNLCLTESIKLPDPLIQVVSNHLDQDDLFHDYDLTALQRAQSKGDMASYLRNNQTLLNVSPSVPACPEVSTFFLQNPTQQSSMDLTASQKIPLVPLDQA